MGMAEKTLKREGFVMTNHITAVKHTSPVIN